MTARTYALDADTCDRWAEWMGQAFGFAEMGGTPHRPMLDAIRAQQPKPRIEWMHGRVIRAVGPRPASWMMAFSLHTSERMVVCVAPNGGADAGDAHLADALTGFDGDTFDPELWEVVE